MGRSIDRRTFVAQTATVCAGVGFGAGVRWAPRVALAADPDLVALITQTPHEHIVEAVAERVRRGASLDDVTGALMLAAVQTVQPYPYVGYKFHAVLTVHSVHAASLAVATSERWLPVFWALDLYKRYQAQERNFSGWTMPPLPASRIPTSASKAQAAFVNALDRWDLEAADAAAAGAARTLAPRALFDALCCYGARDFRDIGHKAIFVANGWRTLQTLGWRHAEPVIRSMAAALVNHRGSPNPATADLDADRPWRRHLELQHRIRPDWQGGRPDVGATRALIAAMRTGSPENVADVAVAQLNRGVAPHAVWDAVFLGSGELLMRQPGIVALHSLTTTNALHHAYRHCTHDSTRRLMLLQACAFVPMFRETIRSYGGALRNVTLGHLRQAEPVPRATFGSDAVFTALSAHDLDGAAQEVVSFVRAGGPPEAIMNEARHLLCHKASESHDFKFSSAVFEDYHHVSPPWRDVFLATSVYYLRGAQDPDNPVMARTREALRI